MNKPDTCSHERQVLSAIGSEMNKSLKLHLESCGSCRDTVAIAEKMRQLAARRIATPPPDPDILWMMARLSRPAAQWTPEVLRGSATLMASALLAVWLWPPIAGYLSSIFLTSCVVAAAIAVVAARSIRLMTGE